MTVAMEMTTADHVARDPSISLVFSQNTELVLLAASSDTSCRYSHNNAEHFSGNTFCITLGSFSLLFLISSLYYTVLDILL